MESRPEFGYIEFGCGHRFELDSDGCVVDANDLIATVRGYGWTEVRATAVMTPHLLYVDEYYESELVLEDYSTQDYEDVEFNYGGVEDFEWDDWVWLICPHCGHSQRLDEVCIFKVGSSEDEEDVELTVAELDPEDNLASFFAELAQKAA